MTWFSAQPPGSTLTMWMTFFCVINSALRYAMRSEDEESAAVASILRRHYQVVR